MYWNSILWFLSWPVLVVITYWLVRFVMRKYATILEEPDEKDNS